MTRLHRFSGLKVIALSAALSMTAGLAIADSKNVSSDQILNALQPKQLTRGMSAGPQGDPAVKAREISFIKTLRNRKTRSLSLGEREEILAITSDKPKIDLDIQFDYNSDKITTTSMLSSSKPTTLSSRLPALLSSIGTPPRNTASMAPISSPSAMARPSRRIQ